MPEPSLVVWILGIPFVLAVVDLVRTALALKRTPPSRTGRGPWSQATRVGT